MTHEVSFGADPILMLELMSRSDEVAYVPLMFGYSNYARPGFAPHIAVSKHSFGQTRAVWKRVGRYRVGCLRLLGTQTGSHRLRAFRGDSGVPKGSLLREWRAARAPGAWTDPKVNQRSSDFFKDTLRTLDLAYLRLPHRVPRIPRTGGGDHQ